MKKAVKIILALVVSLAVVAAGVFVFVESDMFKAMLFDMAANNISKNYKVPEKNTPTPTVSPEVNNENQDTDKNGDETSQDEQNEQAQPEKPASSGPDMSKLSQVTQIASAADKATVMNILLSLLTPEEKAKFAKEYASGGLSPALSNELSSIFYSRIGAQYQTLLSLYNKYADQIK